jgi:hypothetical protein
MLRARAGSRALRSEFAEVFSGLRTPEEAEEITTEPTTTQAVPRWSMGTAEFSRLKSIAGAMKIPEAKRVEIMREVTGARSVEVREVDGLRIPQFTEAEFAALVERLKGYKVAVAAPAPVVQPVREPGDEDPDAAAQAEQIAAEGAGR